jgi:hypothetical protein
MKVKTIRKAKAQYEKKECTVTLIIYLVDQDKSSMKKECGKDVEKMEVGGGDQLIALTIFNRAMAEIFTCLK